MNTPGGSKMGYRLATWRAAAPWVVLSRAPAVPARAASAPAVPAPAVPAPAVPAPAVPARLALRRLPVKRVVPETPEAISVVLAVPPHEADAFAYRAGQFVTVRVVVDGVAHERSYSMSSSPGVDADLQITVKRVPGGRVSNWLNDTVRAGDVLWVRPPSGSFVEEPSARALVALAGGSGIIPVFSLVKAVLSSPSGRSVRLLYANRDRVSAIFARQLDALAHRHPGRFTVQHHADAGRGLVTVAEVGQFVEGFDDADLYVCGPTGFMDVVGRALDRRGVDSSRIHVERFTPVSPVEPERFPAAAPAAPSGSPAPPLRDAPIAAVPEVTIHVGGRSVTVDARPGATILQAARAAGLSVPSSCEIGDCATCMARVVEGRVEMRNNEVLTADEVAEGWVLTCQGEPASATVRVVYE